MKKAKKLLAILPLLFMMAGCGEKSSSSDPTTTDNTVITTNNQDDKTDVRYQIYLSAVSAGYNGNYEEWLESIKGDSIQLKVENNYVMFKYSQATEWVNLISLDTLKGDAGATGKNSKLQVADGFIQWQNEGDTTWNNLIALDDLKGVDGNSRKTDMRVNNDYIQWKYEGDTTWNDLLDLSTLKGADGKNSILRVDGGYIQWKVDEADSWNNLVEISTLKGEKGDEGSRLLMTAEDGFIKCKYESDTSWTNLIDLDTLKGEKGDNGKNTLMQAENGYIQWQNEGDASWNDLVAINDLKGSDGKEIQLREENGIIQWKYDSDTDWTNLYDLNVETFNVTFNLNGAEGSIDSQNIKFGYKATKPEDPTLKGCVFDGWYYNNEKWSFNGYAVTSNMELEAKWLPLMNDIDIFLYDYDSENDTIAITGLEQKYQDTTFFNIFLPNNITKIGTGIVDDIHETIGNVYYNGTLTDWCKIEMGANIIQKCKNFYYLDSNGDTVVNGIRYNSMKTLEVPYGVTEIGKEQFAARNGENGINRLILPSTITSIGAGAFMGNENIEAIYFKGTIAEWCNIDMKEENSNPLGIGTRTRMFVLNDSGAYEEVYYKVDLTGVTTIKDYVFQGLCTIYEVDIPASVTEIGVNPFANCQFIQTITVDSNNPNYESRNSNAVVEKTTNSIIIGCINTDFENVNATIYEKYSFSCTKFATLTIPNGVTEIREMAFIGSEVQVVNLPETLQSIGEFAFCACLKLSIVNNNSTTLYAIGNSAFAYCYELKAFTITETVDYVGEAVFMGDSKLEDVWILCYEHTENYSTINRDTFNGCSGIKTIVLTNEVTKIESNVFNNLTTNTKIFYIGTQSEWNSITISDFGNESLTNATVYYYSEVNPGSSNYWHYVDGVPTVWPQL